MEIAKKELNIVKTESNYVIIKSLFVFGVKIKDIELQTFDLEEKDRALNKYFELADF